MKNKHFFLILLAYGIVAFACSIGHSQEATSQNIERSVVVVRTVNHPILCGAQRLATAPLRLVGKVLDEKPLRSAISSVRANRAMRVACRLADRNQ